MSIELTNSYDEIFSPLVRVVDLKRNTILQRKLHEFYGLVAQGEVEK